MKIEHSIDGNKGIFYINLEGKHVAEMTYSKAGPDKIIIDHTEVDESLKGQGVGYKLVEEAVKYAREKDVKILPLCPFAAAVFKKREAYNDVLF
ncbi:GNAT family N-acetyltransferase [Hanstruepera ponticola]|uniref:GNAT family N-acetyltransferase n=1 Tax=Hanstruepera ponticola TaxID=2042995 RepID=UPI00178092AE|nr:GNAT family N-acetyltransferase [Hanstruepera ponticola]